MQPRGEAFEEYPDEMTQVDEAKDSGEPRISSGLKLQSIVKLNLVFV
jgi:hypothetical protein